MRCSVRSTILRMYGKAEQARNYYGVLLLAIATPWVGPGEKNDSVIVRSRALIVMEAVKCGVASIRSFNFSMVALYPG